MSPPRYQGPDYSEPPYRVNSDTQLKIPLRTLIGVIALTGTVVAMYINVLNTVSGHTQAIADIKSSIEDIRAGQKSNYENLLHAIHDDKNQPSR